MLPSPAAKRGFSLVELMTVVVIMAILAAIAAPSFSDLIATQRIRTAASALYESLLLARSEAIKRNNVVTLSINAGSLASGWNVVLSDGTTVVKSQEAFQTVTFSPASPSLAYSALGRLTSGSLTTVTVSSSDTPRQWTVRADPSGRVCVVEGGSSC